ncbi:MAG: XRE family transcriptional regulator [Verrucomicrobiia bacterium]|jgi:Zn-dependent peptidase ImmA (M78 family)
MNRADPERISQARELAGLSKTKLADLLDVTPAAVAQWESGVKSPTMDNIVALSRSLNFPMPLLLRVIPRELSHKGPVTFRAWNSANTRRANRRAERLAELVAEVFLWLEQHISLPSPSLPEISHRADVEMAAIECRRTWKLGDRPILKLGELIESKGIAIARASFADTRFDAFSCIINGRPYVFLGDEKLDRARSRFDAAHELGHLLLHQHLTESDFLTADTLNTIEAEANRFASAFLMPEGTFLPDVMDASLDGFLKLKPRWGVSVQAMIVRSHDLGIITDNQYRELFRQTGLKGWRRAKGEPFDDMVPDIQGSLGKKSLELLESNAVIHGWEIPTELPMPTHVLCEVFRANPQLFSPSEFGNIIPFERPAEGDSTGRRRSN